MPMRVVPLVRGMLLAAPLALAFAGCVDPYQGAAIDVDFHSGVAGAGDSPMSKPGAPPAGTHYSFYAVQYQGATECVNHCDADGDCPVGTCNTDTHRCEDSGATVRCPTGSSCDNATNICMDDTTHAALVEDSYSFKVNDFQIQPLINQSSPCFIDTEERPYPGIHVTEELARFEQDTGIDDPLNPPAEARSGDITDVLAAKTRNNVLSALQRDLRAVTSYSTALAPGVDPDFPLEDLDEDNNGEIDCADNPNTDPGKIPPIHCTDNASNTRRLALCRAYWKAHPKFYEGSDLIFTLPLNGRWFGAVDGINPKNSIGPLNGASFFVDVALTDFDALVMSWQYSDFDGDGEPDYPAGTVDQDKSPVGYLYISGTPTHVTRGVVNVPLSARVRNITGEAAIYPGLGEDNVHF